MDHHAHGDTERLRGWADRLQATARTGLFFAGNDYDRERYREIISIAAELAGLVTGRNPVDIQRIWACDTGYVTPRVGVGAAIFNAGGEILLLQRPESGLWGLPVGFSEVGETPAEGIAREVREETGLLVRPERLLGVYDCRGGPWLLHHLYNIVFWCTVQGGVLTPTAEAPIAGYFGPGGLPELVPHHAPSIMDAFAAQKGGATDAAFDRFESPG
ncbi:MAG: NUDIX hydrolase N-terminal domain-containing protein [Chloroflexota bacterium]|nr:NUDIX hydrolase N-terminal domain-containing protein [Chloroflexota bacterium]